MITGNKIVDVVLVLLVAVFINAVLVGVVFGAHVLGTVFGTVMLLSMCVSDYIIVKLAL